jgi:Flp pilus assembly pilin Flp
MTARFHQLLNALRPVRAEESAQDTFEYLLVLGVVVVAIVAGVTLGGDFIGGIVGSVTDAVGGLFE